MRDVAYSIELDREVTTWLAAGLAEKGIDLSFEADVMAVAHLPVLVFVGQSRMSSFHRRNGGCFAVATLGQAEFELCKAALHNGFDDIFVSAEGPQALSAIISRYQEWAQSRHDPAQLRPLAALEREAIEAALLACRGQMSMVARRLGIGRSTLYRKVDQYGLRVAGE